MTNDKKLITEEKALKINLTPDIYGCFAEIGAGQEVAANFFQAGASSGTIAYTQSAYDMKVSDSMYGPTNRYVCEERLTMMLFTEYETMRYRLPEKAESTRFFAFCNTVESLNYHKTNQGQGWVGLRYQLHKDQKPNDIILHVKMHDNSNVAQQEALGILGVNLLHAAYFHTDKLEDFLAALVDRLPRERMEIDMLRFTGPDFDNVDNRIIALNLVKFGMTDATMFDLCGNVMQPTEALYKKNILVVRGRFRPVTKVHLDMIENGKQQFMEEEQLKDENVSVIFELTIHGLTNDGIISDKDFIDRVALLGSLGYTVMISNHGQHYSMVEYLSSLSRNRLVGLILNVENVYTIFDEQYYYDLPGGLFQALGQGFGRNVKMLVYPCLDADQQLQTYESITLPTKTAALFQYMKDNNKIGPIHKFDESLLPIMPGHVIERILKGDKSWENDVPEEVSKAIKFFYLFGYKPEMTKA